MIQSMTGYAVANAESPRGALTLELRSVNSRFLDLQFRVAEELRADVIGLAFTLDQMWAARPQLGHGDYRRPLKGLYRS